VTEHIDPDTARLVARLIHTWDGDLQELVALVEMVGRIRQRALMEQQARLIVAERTVAIYQDMILKIFSYVGVNSVEDVRDIVRAALNETMAAEVS
jgi:hypothetical protein